MMGCTRCLCYPIRHRSSRSFFLCNWLRQIQMYAELEISSDENLIIFNHIHKQTNSRVGNISTLEKSYDRIGGSVVVFGSQHRGPDEDQIIVK